MVGGVGKMGWCCREAEGPHFSLVSLVIGEVLSFRKSHSKTRM